MPTITTLFGGVVVLGLVLAVVFAFVLALARLVARREHDLTVSLDARRLRLHVSITSTRSRSAGLPTAPEDDQHSSEAW
jgi:hypothetical protein